MRKYIYGPRTDEPVCMIETADGNGHPNLYLFTGRRLDSETGLYYYRAGPIADST